jgi:polysaccharide deacetylase 2 family uncharacterized protein YibQ
MPRRKPNRDLLAGSARRSLEAMFWIVFVLALGIGGPGALAGLPGLADLMTPPAGVFEAEASAQSNEVVSLQLRPIPATSAAAPATPVRPVIRSVARPGLPAIALVIDDMGSDVVQNRRAIALPKQVSLSFLPYPFATPMLSDEARQAGHEVLVHVPMEAPRDRDGSLANALRRDLPPDENIRRLDAALLRVHGYAGINNHEGSLFTADRRALVPIAEALYGRGVFFLDSRTTPLSQVVPVARAFGVPSSDRDVFLDDVESPAGIALQLKELEKVARTNGIAIAIGHPHAVTLDVVARWCAEQRGFRLVPVSTAIRMKTEWEMGVELANK